MSFAAILNLSRNNFTGPVPESIGQLLNLTVFDLATNLLSGKIPTTISQLVNLGKLFRADSSPKKRPHHH